MSSLMLGTVRALLRELLQPQPGSVLNDAIRLSWTGIKVFRWRLYLPHRDLSPSTSRVSTKIPVHLLPRAKMRRIPMMQQAICLFAAHSSRDFVSALSVWTQSDAVCRHILDSTTDGPG